MLQFCGQDSNSKDVAEEPQAPSKLYSGRVWQTLMFSNDSLHFQQR